MAEGFRIPYAIDVLIRNPANTSGEGFAPADFNGDGEVEFQDFFRFVDALNTAFGDPAWDLSADLNGDVQINFSDFFILGDQFGAPQNEPESPPLSLAQIPNLRPAATAGFFTIA